MVASGGVRISKIVPNPAGIAALQLTPAMQASLKREAERVVDMAKSMARAEAYQTGAYMRSIRAAAGVDKAGRHTTVARVNAFDFKAAWIEWGTQRMPAKHILTRAAEAVGYKIAGQGMNFRRIAAGGTKLWSSAQRFKV
jgi:hypothetical protein